MPLLLLVSDYMDNQQQKRVLYVSGSGDNQQQKRVLYVSGSGSNVFACSLQAEVSNPMKEKGSLTQHRCRFGVLC